MTRGHVGFACLACVHNSTERTPTTRLNDHDAYLFSTLLEICQTLLDHRDGESSQFQADFTSAHPNHLAIPSARHSGGEP